jgi:LysR family transcriptional regulator, glycine cleavage system transcriptional activator
VYVSADDRTVELARGEVDVAIRYLGDSAPVDAIRLFGERMLPVVSADVAADPRTPLKRVADLRHHVLLHLDDPEGRVPWLNWAAWLAANGERDLKAAGSLRFSIYDQVIQATLGGQGVALGRLPMVSELLASGRLVAPFPKRYDSQRGYYVLVAPHANGRADVAAFVAFLRDEAARPEAAEVTGRTTPRTQRAKTRSTNR